MIIKSEKGASAIEFALVMPLLFVLVFGIIEFGILLFDKAVITNASREGARAGVIYRTLINEDGDSEYSPLSDDEIKAIVKDYANTHLINLGGNNDLVDGDIAITVEGIEKEPRESGDNLRVDVPYTYDFLVFPDLSKLLGGNFSGSMTFHGVTLMRVE